MLLIRADGNARIGAGHLMRCLSVAEELAALQGTREQICFLCADEQSSALAGGHGFRSRTLGTDYRDMESELSLWPQVINEFRGTHETQREQKRIILVDSYHVTERYLAALRRYGYVALMDDRGERAYPVDCVVNYNAPASAEAYRELYAGDSVRMLIGSSYTPLRRQFLDRQCADIAGPVKNVLITAGGGDIGNIAGAIFPEIYRRDIAYHLVAGQFNPHYGELKALERTYANLHIYSNVTDMAELMCRCDIAVTAGGSTVYELAAVGVPFICFSCAENQEALTDYVGARSIARAAGAWHRDGAATLRKIREYFDELTESRELREQMSREERTMVDGLGAVRLARELNAAAVQD